MELVLSVESITNLLTDNALHSTKILNVNFGTKKKFVNAVTIQTNITLIITTSVQRKIQTALKSTLKMGNARNAIKDILSKKDNVFLQNETFDFLLYDFISIIIIFSNLISIIH